DFDSANLMRADLRGLRLEGGNFADALLDDANLSGVDCHRASFYRAKLHRALLTGGVFCAADFQLADLRDADIRNADFSSPFGFVRTDLCHADLGGVLWEGANFTGARYDGGTIFPDGFDPVAQGMLFASAER